MITTKTHAFFLIFNRSKVMFDYYVLYFFVHKAKPDVIVPTILVLLINRLYFPTTCICAYKKQETRNQY